jgi:hypothetical protein
MKSLSDRFVLTCQNEMSSRHDDNIVSSEIELAETPAGSRDLLSARNWDNQDNQASCLPDLPDFVPRKDGVRQEVDGDIEYNSEDDANDDGRESGLDIGDNFEDNNLQIVTDVAPPPALGLYDDGQCALFAKSMMKAEKERAVHSGETQRGKDDNLEHFVSRYCISGFNAGLRCVSAS